MLKRRSESMFSVTSRWAIPTPFVLAFLFVAACYENAIHGRDRLLALGAR